MIWACALAIASAGVAGFYYGRGYGWDEHKSHFEDKLNKIQDKLFDQMQQRRDIYKEVEALKAELMKAKILIAKFEDTI